MKTVKQIFGLVIIATLFISCYQEVIVEETHTDPEPAIKLAQLLYLLMSFGM